MAKIEKGNYCNANREKNKNKKTLRRSGSGWP